MTLQNPYAPPQAAIDDVRPGAPRYQAVRLWTARGRIGRLRFLAYGAAAYVAYLVLTIALGALLAALGASGVPAAIAAAVLLIPYFVFYVLNTIQRAHDMNWSGWTCFLLIIPLVGFVFLFKGGTEGRNEYGDPPPPNTVPIAIGALLFPALVLIGLTAGFAVPRLMQHRAAQTPPPAVAR